MSDIEFFTAAMSNFKDLPIDGHLVGLLLMVYKVKIPENSKITLSQEHSGYEWVTPKEAGKRLEYKYPVDFTKTIANL